MNSENEEKTGKKLEISEQPHRIRKKSQPDYEFFYEGIKETDRNWITAIFSFMKNRTGGEVVTILSVVALWRIVSSLIKEKSGLDGMTLTGCLAVSTMIFIIGLLAMLRVTKQKHAKNTQERKSKTSQSGVSTECPRNNGAAPR